MEIISRSLSGRERDLEAVSWVESRTPRQKGLRLWLDECAVVLGEDLAHDNLEDHRGVETAGAIPQVSKILICDGPG
jgi:hypothetical protein